MKILRNNNNNKMYKLIKEYLDRYPELFSDTEKELILRNALECRSEYNYSSDIMREIYDELGLIPDRKNIYIGFCDLIERVKGIENKRIIEVGGGTLPRLAERMVRRTKHGTITVYDPRLSIYKKDSPRLVLKREKFTTKTNVEDVNLLVGLMPCKGAEALIDSAVANKKDFIVGLCEGGAHGDIEDFYETAEEWLDSMLYYAESGVQRSNLGVLKKTYLKRYNYKYPIIYNDRH